MKMNTSCSHRLLEMSTRIDRGLRLPVEMGMYAKGIVCFVVVSVCMRVEGDMGSLSALG